MINQILGYFSYDIGIDLGTANTLVAIKEKGIVINEPSVVAFNKRTKQILAVGDGAKRMVGKTPASIVAVRPLKDGVISDLEATEKMLDYFVKEIHESSSGFLKIPRPRAVIGIPSGITEVEQRAVLKAAKSSGIRKTYLIEEPMAAAIGCKMPVDSPQGNMIIDIGGGTSEIAVISLGGIVINKSLRVGGDKMDEAIVNYVKKRFNVLIGERKAEDAKLSIGDVSPSSPQDLPSKVVHDRVGGVVEEESVSSLEASVEAGSLKSKRDRVEKGNVHSNSVRSVDGLGDGVPLHPQEELEGGAKNRISNFEVRGRNLKTGLPQLIKLSKLDMQQALKEPVDSIIDAVKLALEDTPPDLISDILEDGVYLVGGGARLNGLDKLITSKTGIPVNVPNDPELSVVHGTLDLLDNIELLELVHI